MMGKQTVTYKVLRQEGDRRIIEVTRGMSAGRILAQWKEYDAWHTGSVFMPGQRVTRKFVRDFFAGRVV